MNELPSRSYNANLHVNQAHYQNLVKILYNYIWIEFNWFNLLDDTISMLDTHWSIIIWQKGWSLMYQVKIIIYIYIWFASSERVSEVLALTVLRSHLQRNMQKLSLSLCYTWFTSIDDEMFLFTMFRQFKWRNSRCFVILKSKMIVETNPSE